MKVTDVKPFTVDCFRTNWVFVKVDKILWPSKSTSTMFTGMPIGGAVLC